VSHRNCGRFDFHDNFYKFRHNLIILSLLFPENAATSKDSAHRCLASGGIRRISKKSFPVSTDSWTKTEIYHLSPIIHFLYLQSANINCENS